MRGARDGPMRENTWEADGNSSAIGTVTTTISVRGHAFFEEFFPKA